MGGNNDYLSRKEPCNIHGVRVSTYILSAATHFEDDTVHPHQPKNIMTGFVITGRRHHNIFTSLKCVGVDRLKLGNSTQGFITSDDRFVDRKEGGKIAYEAGQIDKPTECLFSEDLY